MDEISEGDPASENIQSGKVLLNMMNEIITQILAFGQTNFGINIRNVSKQ